MNTILKGKVTDIGKFILAIPVAWAFFKGLITGDAKQIEEIIANIFSQLKELWSLGLALFGALVAFWGKFRRIFDYFE